MEKSLRLMQARSPRRARRCHQMVTNLQYSLQNCEEAPVEAYLDHCKIRDSGLVAVAGCTFGLCQEITVPLY